MAYSYKLHPKAAQEYIASYLWYEEQQSGLGERFASAVRKRLDDLVTNPERYPKKKGSFREIILDKTFPFTIVYFLEKKSSLIVITSIFHTSRHPKHKYRK